MPGIETGNTAAEPGQQSDTQTLYASYASIAELQQSDLLLLVINQVANGKGIVPGKIFEYLGTRKPILS